VPVPRRFDRQPPERDQTRINERIRVSEVRLVDEDGSQIGVIKTDEALAMAQERDLDLVEVAPESRPPVARLLDYSKYKYEQEQKAKAARKHQQQVNVREIKLRPKIADHDYRTKKGHVERFLKHQDKVKVTIMFRGREQAHPERGRALLERLFEDVSELAVIESHPQQEGRNMHMMLAPSTAIAAKAREERQRERGEEDGAVPAEADVPAAEAEAQPAEAAPPEAPTAEEAPAAEAEPVEAPAEAGDEAAATG
jgi:translation initiation factor IF-3